MLSLRFFSKFAAGLLVFGLAIPSGAEVLLVGENLAQTGGRQKALRDAGVGFRSAEPGVGDRTA
jgi:hypothetical protein